MAFRAAVLLAVLIAIPIAVAQPPKAKPKAKGGAVKPPDDATRQAIHERLESRKLALAQIAGFLPDSTFAEVEIYAKAAEWIERHNEYYDEQAKLTVAVLDHGLERLKTTPRTPWRKAVGTSVVRAYRSKVDGSVQPYAVTKPVDYDADPAKSWRLDVVLHGRDSTLTEVKFLNAFKAKPAPKDLACVRIDIFGRTNNAYRWAGEADVFEAMEAFIAGEAEAGRPNAIDRSRVVLHGFSMGGAGSWHLGLHHPSRWAAIGPGAGFTTTKGYAKLPEPLPPYVEKCLRIYDAVEYAENAAAVPVIAYGGEKDPQLQAAKNVEALLKPLGIPMTLFVAPDTEHKLTPEYEKKMEAEYRQHAGPGQGRPAYPNSVRFVTHTLKYNACDWVELHGLGRHYERASVAAEYNRQGYELRTENVTRLRLRTPTDPKGEVVVTVDGETFTPRPNGTELLFERDAANKWRAVGAFAQGLRKSPRLQGPIDDAFTGPFLCVRGTGTPRHPAVNRYALASFERFRKEWDKYLRGALPVKDDSAVTDDDVRTKHLILFGDPGSNPLIAALDGRTPLAWRADKVEIAGVSGDAATTVPVMIHPNPRNPAKYVVVNSGHTFHADAFQGTNALLYPRLGDYALLKPEPGDKDLLAAKVLSAGLFNEDWQAGK